MSASCRGCGAPLAVTFVDLGASPPSNAYLRAEDLGRSERWYPLHAWVCERCFLVQLEAFHEPGEIFGDDYAYFSSYSETWIEHARRYAEAMIGALGLNERSLVVELASNDGYLLRPFAERGIPVLGIEPAANVAGVAIERGIPTISRFFGKELARALRDEGRRPALVVANNVLAHVPDLHDFVAGVALLLDRAALATFEFPHLLTLLAGTEFDTIYHEHFSYFSLLALEPVFAAHGLSVVDVERLPTHGGSLRLHVRRAGARLSPRVAALRAEERAAGLDRLETYTAFTEAVIACKREALAFLLDAQREGKRVAGYGAPAKGNTFLVYCGIRSDLLAFTVDRNPVKQGTWLPGSRIPVHAPVRIMEERPDYVLVLPWNIAGEVMEQMAAIRSWGGRFVTAIPRLHVR